MCANAVRKVYKYPCAQMCHLTVFCVKLTYNIEFIVAEVVELLSIEIGAFLLLCIYVRCVGRNLSAVGGHFHG